MNKMYISSKWHWFWTCFLGSLFTVAMVHAATVFLETYSILGGGIRDTNGVALADGSIVQIIGTKLPTYDPFVEVGQGTLSYTTTGDDVFIGQTTIDSSIAGSGTFYSAGFTFDTADVQWIYLRVFDSSGPLTGLINWAVSDLEKVIPFFGVAEVEFDGGFSTTNYDNFVIIPEPGSGNLLLVFMTVLFGIRYSMRSRKGVKVTLSQNSSLIEDDEKDWL